MGRTCGICKSNDKKAQFSVPKNNESLLDLWIESTGIEFKSFSSGKLQTFRLCFRHFPASDVFFNEKEQKYDRKPGKFTYFI